MKVTTDERDRQDLWICPQFLRKPDKGQPRWRRCNSESMTRLLFTSACIFKKKSRAPFAEQNQNNTTGQLKASFTQLKNVGEKWNENGSWCKLFFDFLYSVFLISLTNLHFFQRKSKICILYLFTGEGSSCDWDERKNVSLLFLWTTFEYFASHNYTHARKKE